MWQTWASGFPLLSLIYKERTVCCKPGPQDLQGQNYMWQTWASGFTRRELYVANLGLRIYKERTICGKPGPQDSHSFL